MDEKRRRRWIMLWPWAALAVAGCGGKRGFMQKRFGFPTGNELLGTMAFGVLVVFLGWLYYRWTR